MLAAARLAFDLSIPTEDIGTFNLAIPYRFGERGWELYERAVAGFYKVVLDHLGWNVSAQRTFYWPADYTASSPGMRDILPSMRPDIVIERPTTIDMVTGRHRVVIDTKFMSILNSGHYGNQRVNSANIYQMYAYLRSQERDDDPRTLDSTGVLLHPAVDCDFDESAVIQGHEIRFATVNLAADTRTIRQQLLRIPYTSPLAATATREV